MTRRLALLLPAVLSLACVAVAQTPAAPAAQTQPQPAQTQPDGSDGNPTLQPRPGTAPENPTFTIQTAVREVNLVFTVTDNHGHFITGLQQHNFALLDDGRPPERVTSFSQQTNLPLRVGIMLDTSNSIRTRFQFEQDAATEFFLQVLHRDDAAFVLGFDVRQDLVQDYTNNIDLLNTAIHKLRPGGGTAFFDALYTTCRDQMLTVRSDTNVRKSIVIVTDGHDNSSRAQENDAVKMCQRAETIVYTISTNTSPTRDPADDLLKRIAEATGGRTFTPNRIEDVAIAFRSIEEELRSQYLLRYTPSDFQTDGSFRSIYLVALDPKYHVRARKGYFAVNRH